MFAGGWPPAFLPGPFICLAGFLTDCRLPLALVSLFFFFLDVGPLSLFLHLIARHQLLGVLPGRVSVVS